MRSATVESLRVLVTVAVLVASFTTGLQAPRREAARLRARASLLGRALLAVGIGPFASMQRMKETRPSARVALELNVIVLVLSIVFVPAAIELLGMLFRRNIHLGVGKVAGVVLGRALVPLALGMATGRLFPRAAAGIGPRLVKIENITLLAVLLLALVATRRELAGIGAAGWLACFAAALGAIAIGHALGGPEPGTRGVVAAASAMRFPALALVLAAALPQGHRVTPVVIVYAVVAFLATTIYGMVMARRRPERETPVVLIGASPRRA